MAEKIDKGSRARITSGKSAQKEGIVFWVGKSKYGPGMRYGLKDDEGQTHWAGDTEIEALEGGAGGGEGKQSAEASSEQRVEPRGFSTEAALKAIKRHLKSYDDKKLKRELDKIPEAEKAAFLFEQVGHRKLEDHYVLTEATGKLAAEVPLATLISALEERSRRSKEEVLPGVGADALSLLAYVDLSDGGYLHGHEEELPEAARWAFWLARGRRKVEGNDPPEAVREAVKAALPAHALSGKMKVFELGQVLSWLKIPREEIEEPTLSAIRKSKKKIPLPALGCPLFAVPFEGLEELAPRLEISHLNRGYLRWWIERRAQVLPEESLEEAAEVLSWIAAAKPKPRKKKGNPSLNRWIEEALEAAALLLAQRGQQEEREVPASLFGYFSSHTTEIGPWLPIFEKLQKPQQEEIYRALLSRMQEHYRPQLIPLRALIHGEQELEVMIAELEEGVRRGNSVSVGHLFTPLGSLGAAAVEPLARRIDALTEALDPAAPAYSTGYKPRRVVIALRDALAVALSKVAAGGDEIEERFDAYLGPEPATLFEGNDDFPYSFFSGLTPASELFASLPEERVVAWIRAWRESGRSAHLEDRLRMALPSSRKSLLRGAPTLGEQIGALADKCGLERSLRIYLLTTKERGKEALAASPLDRVGGLPKGLAKERRPGNGGEPYEPVLSLDLRSVPELSALYPGARAICLFVDRPEEGFEGSEVVSLREEECAAGLEGGRPFYVEAVEVPPEVFALGELSAELKALRRKIGEAEARALGRPFFIQQSPSAGDAVGFVLQAGERFSRLNLGDSGRLFVYSGEAFWECH